MCEKNEPTGTRVDYVLLRQFEPSFLLNRVGLPVQ